MRKQSVRWVCRHARHRPIDLDGLFDAPLVTLAGIPCSQSRSAKSVAIFAASMAPSPIAIALAPRYTCQLRDRNGTSLISTSKVDMSADSRVTWGTIIGNLPAYAYSVGPKSISALN